MLTAETYPAAARAAGREAPGLDLTAMSRVLASYEEVKAERGVIDFEDVLLVLVGILDENDTVARAVREQYRSFVVDEYQDVNALQQRLLDLWLADRQDICVVGDPAQTIYSFTGASPAHLLGFRVAPPAARQVELVRNYRSTPEIVGLANLVLRSPSGGRRSGSVVLEAQRATGAAPTLTSHPDDPAEAAAVAAQVADLIAAGTAPADVAVLFRTNGQSELVESALAERGIPYLVRGGERFFQRKEVREAIVLMRGAARSDDGSVPLPDLVRDVLLGAGWSREAPAAGGASRERWESLSALAALADDVFAADAEARMPAFVRELDERMASQHAPSVQGVTLASLHAAKGLEWGTVFLIGCSDGYLPITMADTPEAIEEERRLLYVGVTRARDRLVLSWSGARTPGARATRRPSRFLDGTASILGEGARSQPKGPRGSGARRRHQGAQGPPTQHLPHLRRRPRDRGRAHGRAVRVLPRDLRRGDVRAPARVAAGDGARGQRAGIRRLHRRHADGHRRADPGRPRGALVDQRRGPAQARPLRRPGPGRAERRDARVGGRFCKGI